MADSIQSGSASGCTLLVTTACASACTFAVCAGTTVPCGADPELAVAAAEADPPGRVPALAEDCGTGVSHVGSDAYSGLPSVPSPSRVCDCGGAVRGLSSEGTRSCSSSGECSKGLSSSSQ